MASAWIARRAAGAAGRRLAEEAQPSADVLRGRLRVDPDWRRVEDGRAARLGVHDTIEVTRRRSWRSRDPLVVEPGWLAPWKALGLGLWAAAVGLAWWQGSQHGRGPLSPLADRTDPWD